MPLGYFSHEMQYYRGGLNTLSERLKNNWLQKLAHRSEQDDSLTNLTWLYVCSISILPIFLKDMHPIGVELDAAQSQNAVLEIQNNLGSHLRTRIDEQPYAGSLFDPQVRFEYRTKWTGKPPFSYATLICLAMRELGKPKVTLSDIYGWIMGNFSYYRHTDSSWQNSVRHNLSLNKCFEKVPRDKSERGKGGFWRVNPKHADWLEANLAKCRRAAPPPGPPPPIPRSMLLQQRQQHHQNYLRSANHGILLPGGTDTSAFDTYAPTSKKDLLYPKSQTTVAASTGTGFTNIQGHQPLQHVIAFNGGVPAYSLSPLSSSSALSSCSSSPISLYSSNNTSPGGAGTFRTLVNLARVNSGACSSLIPTNITTSSSAALPHQTPSNLLPPSMVVTNQVPPIDLYHHYQQHRQMIQYGPSQPQPLLPTRRRKSPLFVNPIAGTPEDDSPLTVQSGSDYDQSGLQSDSDTDCSQQQHYPRFRDKTTAPAYNQVTSDTDEKRRCTGEQRHSLPPSRLGPMSFDGALAKKQSKDVRCSEPVGIQRSRFSPSYIRHQQPSWRANQDRESLGDDRQCIRTRAYSRHNNHEEMTVHGQAHPESAVGDPMEGSVTRQQGSEGMKTRKRTLGLPVKDPSKVLPTRILPPRTRYSRWARPIPRCEELTKETQGVQSKAICSPLKNKYGGRGNDMFQKHGAASSRTSVCTDSKKKTTTLSTPRSTLPGLDEEYPDSIWPPPGRSVHKTVELRTDSKKRAKPVSPSPSEDSLWRSLADAKEVVGTNRPPGGRNNLSAGSSSSSGAHSFQSASSENSDQAVSSNHQSLPPISVGYPFCSSSPHNPMVISYPGLPAGQGDEELSEAVSAAADLTGNLLFSALPSTLNETIGYSDDQHQTADKWDSIFLPEYVTGYDGNNNNNSISNTSNNIACGTPHSNRSGDILSDSGIFTIPEDHQPIVGGQSSSSMAGKQFGIHDDQVDYLSRGTGPEGRSLVTGTSPLLEELELDAADLDFGAALDSFVVDAGNSLPLDLDLTSLTTGQTLSVEDVKSGGSSALHNWLNGQANAMVDTGKQTPNNNPAWGFPLSSAWFLDQQIGSSDNLDENCLTGEVLTSSMLEEPIALASTAGRANRNVQAHRLNTPPTSSDSRPNL